MTIAGSSEQPRWYEDACGAAHALELLGERWALLVVRELVFGPRRFGELRDGLPGVSANVLTQRLSGLMASGIVMRRELASPVNAPAYELTPWGHETKPIFEALGRWAARSPSHDPTLPLSAASLLLSFGTMLDAERAKGVDLTVGLDLEGDTFVVRVQHRRINVRRAPIDDDLQATLRAAPAVIASVVYGGRPLTKALAAGEVIVEGDRAAARAFLSLFLLPPKASR